MTTKTNIRCASCGYEAKADKYIHADHKRVAEFESQSAAFAISDALLDNTMATDRVLEDYYDKRKHADDVISAPGFLWRWEAWR